MTAFGVMIAVRIKQMQSFMGVTQMVVMPMFFISGALFPVTGLPAWLAVLNRLDPITYAVDPMRKLVLGRIDVTVPGVTWFGWHVPVALEVLMVFLLGLGMLAIAVWEFSGTE
jgi:ABC-2 type transport system permease protein